jgi:hypothetical protein
LKVNNCIWKKSKFNTGKSHLLSATFLRSDVLLLLVKNITQVFHVNTAGGRPISSKNN